MHPQASYCLMFFAAALAVKTKGECVEVTGGWQMQSEMEAKVLLEETNRGMPRERTAVKSFEISRTVEHTIGQG